MHVLVATDGNLDPDAVAAFAGPLAGPDGKVTVLTIIAIPRRLLSDLRRVYGERSPVEVEGDAEYIGMATEGGDAPVGWPGDSEMVGQYLSAKEQERCEPIAATLRAAGANVETRVDEGEHIARTIIGEIPAMEVDVLVIGSHGEGRFEGVLGSTGMKLARHSPCPVLVLRSA